MSRECILLAAQGKRLSSDPMRVLSVDLIGYQLIIIQHKKSVCL